MGSAWLLFLLILLGFPGYPLSSDGYIDRSIPKDFLHVVHNYINNLHFPFNLPDILPGSFCSGSDIYEFFWKCVTLTAYLGICFCAIFIWRTVLPVKHHTHQVNLEQISKKIKNIKDENAEIVKNISFWEKKAKEIEKCVTENKWQTILLSEEAKKFKDYIKTVEGDNEMLKQIIETLPVALKPKENEDVINQVLLLQNENACLRNKNEQAEMTISAFEEVLKEVEFKLTSLLSIKGNLEEYQKQLKDDCESLRSAVVEKEIENRVLHMKLEMFDDIYQRIMTSTEQKLKDEEHRRQETEQQLLAAEEKQKLATEEVENYKRTIEHVEQELQEAVISFRKEMALLAKREDDSWIRAQESERAMVEETRVAADSKHRPEVIQNMKTQEGCGSTAPMPGRPDTQNPPHRDAGNGAAPRERSNIRSSSPTKMMEEVNMAARGPPPFQGPRFMCHPMQGPPPPLMGYGPPPPPWWPHRPHPLPPHRPLGQRY